MSENIFHSGDEDESIAEMALSLPADAVIARRLLDMVIAHSDEDGVTKIPAQTLFEELIKAVSQLEGRLIALDKRLDGD